MNIHHQECDMAELFAQLGLANREQEIEQFIASHQLANDISLDKAPFLNDTQRAFVVESWQQDSEFSYAIDELNLRLHGG